MSEHRSIARGRPSRALVLLGLLGLLGSACGQLGGVHQRTVGVVPVGAVAAGGSGVSTVAGSVPAGASIVDVGGAQGETISGDPTSLPPGSPGGAVSSTTISTTSVIPLTIHVPISN